MPLRYNEDGSLTDGIFDDQHTKCREKFIAGKITNVISKMWIESTDEKELSRLEDWMKLDWGTYPDMPKRGKQK